MLSNECSILLIDDDADVLDAYTQLLEQAGYHVHACDNPFAAREWVQKDWPGIVLSDVCMPGCSGIDLMTLFHQDDELLPIVLITGHGDVPMAVEEMKRGAVDFLQKPVSLKPLQAALEHGLTVSGERFAQKKVVDCYQQLTPKERELALLVMKGLMNREIAQAMSIAVRTVEVHRARVMEKMQAGSLAELVSKLQRVTR